MIFWDHVLYVSHDVCARCDRARISPPIAKIARNTTCGHTFAHVAGATMADATGPPRDRPPFHGPREQSPVETQFVLWGRLFVTMVSDEVNYHQVP